MGLSIARKEKISIFCGPGLVDGKPVDAGFDGGLQNYRERTVSNLEVRFIGGIKRPRILDRFPRREMIGQALVVCPAQTVPIGSGDAKPPRKFTVILRKQRC